MIRLHPIPDAFHTCPYCQIDLDVVGWCIPGMRNLADLVCSKCGRAYYGDLPAGHGLYYPMLLERGTDLVHDAYGVPWFADWLRRSYTERKDKQIDFHVEALRPVERPVLLNCLDTLYGHCLLKLLNAQYYLDHKPEIDLIVLIPRLLRWMVPEGVAEIWTVDLPSGRGIEWNDWLAAELRKRVAVFGECGLSIAFSHPHPDDFQIERFTRVCPFRVDDWESRLERPKVTFVWREDRLWEGREHSLVGRLSRRVREVLGVRSAKIDGQRRRVIGLADALRLRFPKLDFAIVGTDCTGRFPSWIADLRKPRLDDATERSWCERYASSHIAVGVHGSNMLLPSAHAGAVVELMPRERWGNMLQDLLLRPADLREAMFRCRVLPASASVMDVAEMVASMLADHRGFVVNMRREFCDHNRIGRLCARPTARKEGLARLP